MLTEQEQLRLIDWFFSPVGQHPEVCRDDFNIFLISQFIKANTAGMEYLNRESLEWAVQSLTGKLHIYANVDVSAQLAAGAEAQQRLAEELAEKNRKAEIQRRELEKQAHQDARRPGASSAFGSTEDRAEMERQSRLEAQNGRDAILLRARHLEFNQLVRDARIDASSQIHSRKQGRWDALYAKIKQRFTEPEFTATL